ncbi:MAG: inositol monophosphatase family protein [Clostridia bacterium]|nr:inositol monophosphatase family protein [Clostridia bacterium]
MNYSDILTLMQDVSRRAGQYLLTQTVSVMNHKTRNDLLTENDLVIENFIIDGIRAVYPDIHIVSEEYNPDNSLDGLTVVIDPIDGTCNFAQGLSLYGIQLALFYENICRGAVLYFPVEDTMYVAEEGKGAYKNGKRLFVDQKKPSSDGFLIISDYYDSIDIAFDQQFALVKALQKHFLKTRHFGAACVDFTMLAEGHALAYITYYHKLWDIAPGLLLAKEAGFVYGAVDQDDYHYHRPGLVVANSEQTLSLIKEEAKRLGMMS